MFAPNLESLPPTDRLKDAVYSVNIHYKNTKIRKKLYVNKLEIMFRNT